MEPVQQIRRFVRRWTDRLILERKRITVMDQLANENKLKEEIIRLREDLAREREIRHEFEAELETAHNIIGNVIDALPPPPKDNPSIGWADLGARVKNVVDDRWILTLTVARDNNLAYLQGELLPYADWLDGYADSVALFAEGEDDEEEFQYDVETLRLIAAKIRLAIPETSSKPSEQNQ